MTEQDRKREAERNAAAFNAGSNARIAGLPMTTNPHRGNDFALSRWWDAGWRDVSDFWGVHALREVPDLPPLPDSVAQAS